MHCNVLSDLEADLCEGKVTEDECNAVVKNLSKNKAPGYDGLPSEFYQVLWPYIKSLLVKSFNEAFDEGELSESHKYIIISLIFKKGDRKLLKNYRPISLSNVDYKILAFILANRLHKVISSLISPEQTSYIKERYIGQNVRFLIDVIEYAKSNNKTGILLFLDFEKAFDSIDWDFIDKCLHKMGFKDNFCKWIKLIYTDPKAFLKINGFLSKTISLNRGTRQGCPLSCLIFIICTEILAQHIKQGIEIHGFDVPHKDGFSTVKLTQYADDICLFLRDVQSINAALQVVTNFSSVSGLKLNMDKTEGLYFGNTQNRTVDYDKIKWPNEPIKYLGIYISNNQIECDEKNWLPKYEKMQKLLDSWRKRKLTLYGKITIIKTIILPKIIYLATLLPIPTDTIKIIEKMFFEYIWGKTDKIKRKVIVNKCEKGGLNMIDIKSHLFALKAAWMPRIAKNDNLWTYMPELYIRKATYGIIEHMSFCSVKQFPRLKSIPQFYQEVICSFCRTNIPNDIITKNDLFNQPLWGNRHILHNGKCLYNTSFIKAGFIFVFDILNEDGTFKDQIYDQLVDKSQYIRTMFLMKNSLKAYRHLRFAHDQIHMNPQTRCTKSKRCKYFYEYLLKQAVSEGNALSKLNEEFSEELDWKTLYENKITDQFELKFAELNYKIYNNIIPTGKNLHKWKKISDSKCIYCGVENHDVKHLLFTCSHIDNVWKEIENILGYTLGWRDVIIGIKGKHNINCITSLVCYCIYKKYITDRNSNGNYCKMKMYMKQELVYKEEIYLNTLKQRHVAPQLRCIINKL